MNQYNDDYGEWWTGEVQNCNIYSALSNNLQKYESIYKHSEHRLLKLALPKKHSNSQPPVQPPQTAPHLESKPDPSIQESEERKRVKYRNWLQRETTEGQNVNVLNRGSTRQKQFKIRVRNSQSSHQNRDDRLAVKLREIKFVKRDKKKFKDRCVELYAETRSKNKISLKEIDNINKQFKEERIDLFLKLLRR